jgi:pyridoxal phosphate enzyme (YggS family)
MDLSYIDKNVEGIRARIAEAARDVGRESDEVLMMCAVKSADVDMINYIHRKLGVTDIGENRVQQLTERWDKLDRDGLRVHFIGSLQTNKVKYIIDKVHLIHSLDSERLAAEIDRQAKKHSLVANVLVEINSGGEESKGGIPFDEVERFCLDLGKYQNIRLCGFMTMAPRCESQDGYIGYFSKTREVAERVWYTSLGHTEPPILSMGMSESFEPAIKCGATVVRIGRSIFTPVE